MLRILRNIRKKELVYISVSLVFIVIQVWLDLKMPEYMSSITTLVETEGSLMSDILLQGWLMLLCAVGSMITSIIVGYFASKVAAGLSYTLRGKIYDRVMDFSMAEINGFSTASLINRTTNDITQIQNLVAMGLQAIIKAPILAVWAVMKIYNKSWQWTTATSVAVILLIIMLGIILAFALPRFKKIQILTDDLNRVTREHLTGIRVVHAYNAEKYQEKKFEEVNNELTANNLTVNRFMSIMNPGMTFINAVLSLAIYGIGAYLISTAAANIKLSIFSDMVVLSNYAMQVIMAFMLLNLIFILLPRASVSAKRILEVLDTAPSIMEGKGTNPKETGTIEFKNVSFRYPDAGADTLSDISFTVNKGETVAVIGAIGSGKSSLINLIPRFYDVSGGEVLVDGENVKDYAFEDLHNRIGYVSQKTVMFSGTVSSNISIGRRKGTKPSEFNIHEAIRIAQGTEFVEKMDGTYGAAIAQGGSNVSGGQKQRLSIARALAGKPEILIFDDSFSALDYQTDRKLRQTLNEEYPDTTKVIVAQRIGTIKNADKILVLEHGKLVGCGRHLELMENCQAYREIAQSQLSKEELSNG